MSKGDHHDSISTKYIQWYDWRCNQSSDTQTLKRNQCCPCPTCKFSPGLWWCSSSPPAKQHHGEQPFGFQRQPRIAQVVVGHHRIATGFLNAKYRHGITSFRRSGKVLIFGEKVVSMPPEYPRKENLWVADSRLTVEEKTWDLGSFRCSFEKQ